MSSDLKISQMVYSAARPVDLSSPWVGGTPLDNYRGNLLDLTGIYQNFTAGARPLTGVPTASWNSAGGVSFVVNGGIIYPYVLRAGADAQDVPNIIRPSDYAPGTNEFVYDLLTFYTGGIQVGSASINDTTLGPIFAAGGAGNRNIFLTATGASGNVTVNGAGLLVLNNGTNQATFTAAGAATWTANPVLTPPAAGDLTVVTTSTGKVAITNTSGPTLQLSNLATTAAINLSLYSSATSYGQLSYLPAGGANDGLKLIDARTDAQAKVMVVLQSGEVARFVGGNLLIGTTTNVTGVGGISTAFVTAPATTDLTLAGGSGAVNGVVVNGGATNLGGLNITGAGSNTGLRINNTSAGGKDWYLLAGNTASTRAGMLTFYENTGSVFAMNLTSTGNLLIGGTTDIAGSGNLKVFGTGTSYFGGNLQLFGTGNFVTPRGYGLDMGANSGQVFIKSDPSANLILTAAGGLTTVNSNLTVIGTGASSFAGVVKVTGANLAHSASNLNLAQEGDSLSQIVAYGADAATNGRLKIVSRRSDGSSEAVLIDAQSTGVTLAGHLTVGSSGYNTIIQDTANGVGYTKVGDAGARFFYTLSNRAGFDAISTTAPFVGIADSTWSWLRSDTSNAGSGIQLVTGSMGEVRVSNNLKVAGSLIATNPQTPASATAAGTTGTITWDASYIYVCTATNTWKRVAIATW